MTDNTEDGLFKHTSDSYGDSYGNHLMEQYKLFVQSAENTSTRRIASISHLLTLNLGIFAIYGVQLANFEPSYWMIVVSFVGLVASAVWIQTIESYSNLNALKFRAILEIERQLPVAPFEYEWRLRKQCRSTKYIPVTHTEKWIPVALIGLHSVVAIVMALATNGWIDLPK